MLFSLVQNSSPLGNRVCHCSFGVLAIAILLSGCSGKSGSHADSKAPAKVEKLPQETEIARITLSDAADKRLGISLTEVSREHVKRRRTFGGEVMIPGGKSIIVSAPVAGTIAPPDQGAIPLPGERVAAATPVLSLLPLLTPERYVPTPAEKVQIANARATLMSALTVAKGDVQRSEAEVEAAQIALNRAKQLLADKVGTAKAVDDAQAVVNIATPTLTAAKERQRQFESLLGDLETSGDESEAAQLIMRAPQSGVIRSLAVSLGQTVSAGGALFEVVDTSTMWIRVPLYVDLIPEIDTQAEAQLVALGQRASGSGRSATHDGAKLPPKIMARPVVAPPSADPLSTTADLYYEVENTQNEFRPGQRIGVELELQGEDEGLVVSAKAVLYDIYGGTWVYVKVGEHAYQRQRVLIRYTADQQAILDEGPSAGTQVVMDGAAELYGTEFGAGK